MDTIFAQSSARGKAGVAIFRISGPNSLAAMETLTDIQNITPRMLHLKTLTSSRSNENKVVIDNAMVVYFKAPNSFTGEDVVEIHTHGSIAIAQLLTESLLSAGLLRLAEPGEFAKRAFLNGKLDLTSAEGLADLIEAETIMQHRQAMRQMSGELEKLYGGWRKELLGIISFLEAYIDFPDEDIPDSVLQNAEDKIHNLTLTLQKHLSDNRRGERLRNGLKLTILGAPNVGKSSLLNFLAQREIAIVSDIAGTTRDVIETHLDIGGYPIILTDTAGIRKDTEDLIEKEGIKRALKEASHSDIKLVMFEADSRSPEIEELIDFETILVMNKIDLYPETSNVGVIPISLKLGKGLDALLKAIEQKAESISPPSEAPSITRLRQRTHIEQGLSALQCCNLHEDLVLATEDIRIAVRAFEAITGKLEVDEILGEIFSNFCIGK
ncbi:MAG: tRNA uridine-5-carboxymethylaminomethyl(34) synthesis GTPase MnmE [Pseudomonadota bacterium]